MCVLASPLLLTSIFTLFSAKSRQSRRLFLVSKGNILSGALAKASRREVCPHERAGRVRTARMNVCSLFFMLRYLLVSLCLCGKYYVFSFVSLFSCEYPHGMSPLLMSYLVEPIYRNTIPRSTSRRSMALLRKFFSRKTKAPTRKLTSTLPRRIMLTTLTSEPSMLKA